MGRTLTTFRWLFESEKDDLIRKFKWTHHHKDIEELLSQAFWFNDAGTNWSNGQIKNKMFFLMLFAQYKRISQYEKNKVLKTKK